MSMTDKMAVGIAYQDLGQAEGEKITRVVILHRDGSTTSMIRHGKQTRFDDGFAREKLIFDWEDHTITPINKERR